MKKSFNRISILILAAILLSACGGRAARALTGGQAQNPQPVAAQPTAVPLDGAAETEAQPTLAPTLPPTLVPTQTPVTTQTPQIGQTALAEQQAQAYFDALQKGDVDAASRQLSTFSLLVFSMTPGDAASALNKQKIAGTQWSDFKVLDSKPFDPQTVLVHVQYVETDKSGSQTRDQLWPMRLENGVWRYNYQNLIDYHSLSIPPQTTAGVTVLPVQMRRYSDRLDLVMIMQNRTNDAVVFGQANEVLGTFHFGDQTVEAAKTQIILPRLYSKPEVTLTIAGLCTSYPDSVEIRKWKNLKVQPWYVFNLQ